MASGSKSNAPFSLNSYFLCIIRFAVDILYFYTQIKASLENVRQDVDFEWDHYFKNIGPNYKLVLVCKVLFTLVELNQLGCANGLAHRIYLFRKEK